MAITFAFSFQNTVGSWLKTSRMRIHWLKASILGPPIGLKSYKMTKKSTTPINYGNTHLQPKSSARRKEAQTP